MDFNEIKELIKLVNETNISEIKITNESMDIVIRTKNYTKAIKGNKKIMTQQLPVSLPAPVIPNISPVDVSISKGQAPIQENALSSAVPNTHNNGSSASDNNILVTDNSKPVTSPMIGTFYRASGPGKEPYVKIGDVIEKGQVVCIIEAMKLYNEVQAEFGGKIVEVLVENKEPVEYGQALFKVEPA